MRNARILPVALILATATGFTGVATAAANAASSRPAATHSGGTHATAAKVSKKYCRKHPTDRRCEARR